MFGIVVVLSREALFLGLPLVKGKHLGQDSIVVHHRPSTCVSAASTWGSQKVISIDRYISIAVESAVRAYSRWPVLA
jgi:hypothetical protein